MFLFCLEEKLSFIYKKKFHRFKFFFIDQNPTVAEKIYRIDDHCAVGIAGITADANALISQLRAVGE